MTPSEMREYLVANDCHVWDFETCTKDMVESEKEERYIWYLMDFIRVLETYTEENGYYPPGD